MPSKSFSNMAFTWDSHTCIRGSFHQTPLDESAARIRHPSKLLPAHSLHGPSHATRRWTTMLSSPVVAQKNHPVWSEASAVNQSISQRIHTCFCLQDSKFACHLGWHRSTVHGGTLDSNQIEVSFAGEVLPADIRIQKPLAVVEKILH